MDLGSVLISVESSSSFKSGDDVVFEWFVRNIEDTYIDYKGTEHVVIRLYDDKGNLVEGIPDAYTDLAVGASCEPGIILEGIKVYEGLKPGTYSMEIEVGWMEINGVRIHDVYRNKGGDIIISR